MNRPEDTNTDSRKPSPDNETTGHKPDDLALDMPESIVPDITPECNSDFGINEMGDCCERYVPMVETRAIEVFEAMRPRVSDADYARLVDAFLFAKKAHSGQRRKSKEPYITHPIAVARIAAVEFKVDVNVVIGCFLHDVVEDTDVTLEDIRRRFGDDVASLVRVVTKPKRDKYEMSKQLDNFKQMLNAMRDDIRGILIKLADRLHNMRTLSSMRADKQMKIAGETDYFYAPLANRLGFYEVKTELENLSFRYRCPHEYDEFTAMIASEKMMISSRLNIFASEVRELLAKKNVEAKVEIIYREPYSLWRKIKKYNTDFHHLEFKHFIQITFPDTQQELEKSKVLEIYSLLTDVFKEKQGGIANYIDSPKENGYQSFHVKLLSHTGNWEEVHISSQRMVDASSQGCLACGNGGAATQWLKKFRSTLDDISRSNSDAHFIENVVTAFYNDDILVFTPQGKPINLPQRATALDFAFEVHSKIGEFAKFARVNGRLCSVRTVLKRGDVVEIFTAEDAKPDPAWLNTVVTYKAKRFLRNYISRLPKIPYKLCSHCRPIPGEEVIGFDDGHHNITLHKRDCPEAIGIASKLGDSIVPVHFAENPDILYPITVRIKGVDRVHMLQDLIECISEKMRLYISKITTSTQDSIFDLSISFSVHSYGELQRIIAEINSIPGVDEVGRVNE